MYDGKRLTQEALIYSERYREILERMISGMTDAHLCDSISHNFIVQMIPHHMAAIEMSENLLKYVSDGELSDIARGIISEQTNSIESMKEILSDCAKCRNSMQDICLYQKSFWEITQRMFSQMSAAPVLCNIGVSFMLEMIPHHKGAIKMSESALRFDICGGLRPILDNIIVSQRRGVCEMEELLRKKC